jgi:prepilin-type processing-associated H-X9-DG protein
MTNLRGLGQSYQMYLSDERERLPSMYFYFDAGNPDYTWVDALGRYTPKTRADLNPTSSWYCPTNPYLPTAYGTNAGDRAYQNNQIYTTYGINMGLQQQGGSGAAFAGYWNKGGGYSPQYGWNTLSNIKTSYSRVCNLTDVDTYVRTDLRIQTPAGGEVSYYRTAAGVREDAFKVKPYGSYHNGGVSLTFLDGHTESVKYETVPEKWPYAKTATRGPYAFNY